MLTREEIQGSWNQLKGKIREKWGEITDDELQRSQGDSEQLVGMLQKKTGQTRQQIEQFLDEAYTTGKSMWNQATQTARDYAQAASNTVRQGYQQVEEQFGSEIESAQQMVRARPIESVTAAFGVGMITGVVISLMLRSSRA